LTNGSTIKWPVSGTPDNLGLGMWARPNHAWAIYRISAELSTGEFVGIRSDPDNKTYDAYVDGSKVADGTADQIATWAGVWHNVQMYVYLHDTVGEINAWIDGIQILDYEGDTIPAGATGTVVKIRLYTFAENVGIDDLVWGTGGPPGDIRVDYLVPTADTVVDDWTPTAGDNYSCVDEVPKNDADYVYTTTNGHSDEYELGDFTATNKTIIGVTALARAKQNAATGEQIKIGVDSNGTDDTTTHNLTTNEEYYMHNMALNPDDAGAWEDADIDALKFRLEAVI
jgi:hypothetical protein